jgi:hypothetical protein
MKFISEHDADGYLRPPEELGRITGASGAPILLVMVGKLWAVQKFIPARGVFFGY